MHPHDTEQLRMDMMTGHYNIAPYAGLSHNASAHVVVLLQLMEDLNL